MAGLWLALALIVVRDLDVIGCICDAAFGWITVGPLRSETALGICF